MSVEEDLDAVFAHDCVNDALLAEMRRPGSAPAIQRVVRVSGVSSYGVMDADELVWRR
jgi:hypothetical protein